MGSGDRIQAPLLKDAATLGIIDIANQVYLLLNTNSCVYSRSNISASRQTAAFGEVAGESISTGTFSIHDLGAYILWSIEVASKSCCFAGSYGVKSAAAIVLPPQVCSPCFCPYISPISEVEYL